MSKWSPNASYSTSQAEQIILIISNACGNTTDTLEIIESSTGPQIDLGDDINICEGSSVTIQSGVLGVDYLWQDGSTGPDFTTDQSMSVILEVSNNCGVARDTVLVDVSGTVPKPDLGPDSTVCDGVVLVLTSNADALTEVQWQDGSTSLSYNVTQSGTYILVESNHCGTAADTMDVNFISAPEPFTLGSDTVLCPGETVVLTAPITTDHLQWQDGSQGQTFNANQSGIYSLEISNACGVQKDELELSVNAQMPVVNQVEHHSICLGQELLFNVQQAFPATYAWNDGYALPELIVTMPGTYTVEIKTDCSTASGTFDVVQDTDCDFDVSGEIYIPNIFSPDGDGINDLFLSSLPSMQRFLIAGVIWSFRRRRYLLNGMVFLMERYCRPEFLYTRSMLTGSSTERKCRKILLVMSHCYGKACTRERDQQGTVVPTALGSMICNHRSFYNYLMTNAF